MTRPLDGSRTYERAVWCLGVLVTILCWLLTARDARQMGGGMPMAGGWTMSMTWMIMPGQSLAGTAAMFLAMWTVMMLAMMLPSVLPVVLLYRRLAVTRRSQQLPVAPEAVLAVGYFSGWAGFGLIAFAVGLWFAGLTMREETVSRAVPFLTAATLVTAGVYQLTPLKRMCLRHCRSPLSFFMTSWRDGWIGTFRLGLHHGSYCVACCWALMVIQLVLGVMNLWLMALVAIVIALEKSSRHGERIAAAAGVIAIAAGLLHVVLLLSPRG